MDTTSFVEPKVAFRADVDDKGVWYVWHRMGRGWATYRRCASREEARQLTTEMNDAASPQEFPREQ